MITTVIQYWKKFVWCVKQAGADFIALSGIVIKVLFLFVIAVILFQEGWYWLINPRVPFFEDGIVRVHQAIREIIELRRIDSVPGRDTTNPVESGNLKSKGEPRPGVKVATQSNQVDTTAHILTVTQNLLVKTGNLLMFFTVVAVVFSVLFGFFGVKWFEQISTLRNEVISLKKAKLDAAKLTLSALPELNQTQQIPDKFSGVLSNLHAMINDREVEELIDRNPDYEELRLADALYLIATHDYDKAKQRLEDIQKRYLPDGKIYDEVRYRLGLVYRKLGHYKGSYETFGSVVGEKRDFGSFGKAVTMFAHMQTKKLDTELVKEYTIKGPQEFVQQILNELTRVADKHPDIATMQFLAAEFMGYVYFGYNSLTNVLEKDTGKAWTKDNWWAKTDEYIEKAIGLSVMLPILEIDRKIKANWYYALALLYFYRETKAPGTAVDGLKNKVRENLNNARRCLDGVEYVFSEVSQAEVPVKQFLDEVSNLEAKI